MNDLLKVTDLHVYFQTPAGIVKANNGINLSVANGDTLGIIGESGCGKTVLFLALLRLQQPGEIIKGKIEFNGTDILKLSEKVMIMIRGRQIGFIPQNQATALNQSYTIEQHFSEILKIRAGNHNLWAHLTGRSSLSIDQKLEVTKELTRLGLSETVKLDRLLKSYPHQLSGGMRQRILTTMALLLKPRLLIADEPTTALDAATRRLSLNILKTVKEQATLMLVSHDIEAISGICNRIAVMYSGRIIEDGPATAILNRPRHPYTVILLSCRQLEKGLALPKIAIDAQDMVNLPPGCAFHPFCPEVMPLCKLIAPGTYNDSEVRVACHRFNAGEKYA